MILVVSSASFGQNKHGGGRKILSQREQTGIGLVVVGVIIAVGAVVLFSPIGLKNDALTIAGVCVGGAIILVGAFLMNRSQPH